MKRRLQKSISQTNSNSQHNSKVQSKEKEGQARAKATQMHVVPSEPTWKDTQVCEVLITSAVLDGVGKHIQRDIKGEGRATWSDDRGSGGLGDGFAWGQ